MKMTAMAVLLYLFIGFASTVHAQQVELDSWSCWAENARNIVESQRPSIFIRYATAETLASGFLAASVAIEDSSKGIWR